MFVLMFFPTPSTLSYQPNSHPGGPPREHVRFVASTDPIF
jgi:hypothetical protein